MASALYYSHFRGDPYFNMAFDEWLLARALVQPYAAFLRLYCWKIGTITIGYNQHQQTAYNSAALGDTPVIRRITGGRALYHDPMELTYSIVVHMAQNSNGRLSGSLADTSATIAQALTAFLNKLGIEAAYVRQSARENATPAFFHKAPCFSSVAKYEVVAAGGKIIASAQKRVGDALLQHGSIKLHGIAQHPALNMDTPNLSRQHPDLTATRFAALAELFRATVSDGLAISFQPAGTEKDMPGLTQQVVAVQKNPLLRRDIVKQTVDASSL